MHLRNIRCNLFFLFLFKYNAILNSLNKRGSLIKYQIVSKTSLRSSFRRKYCSEWTQLKNFTLLFNFFLPKKYNFLFVRKLNSIWYLFAYVSQFVLFYVP